MTRWEYKRLMVVGASGADVAVVDNSGGPEADLDGLLTSLGDEGWELVGTLAGGGGIVGGLLMFMRPILDEEDEEGEEEDEEGHEQEDEEWEADGSPKWSPPPAPPAQRGRG